MNKLLTTEEIEKKNLSVPKFRFVKCVRLIQRYCATKVEQIHIQ